MYDIRTIADERTRAHISDSSTRPPTPDYVGVAGEISFAREFRLKVDTISRPSGDGGSDFTTPVRTIDVKIHRKPY